MRKYLPNYFLILLTLWVLNGVVTFNGNFNVLDHTKDAFFRIYIIGTAIFLIFETDFMALGRKYKYFINFKPEDSFVSWIAVPWVVLTFYTLTFLN